MSVSQLKSGVGWHLPFPIPALPSPTHGQARKDLQFMRPAGCSKHQITSRLPSGGGLQPSQRVFASHKGPTATSALLHLCPDMGPPANPPLVPPLPLSSLRESETGEGLSAEQLFISLCRGNLGLFMEIQTLLNNRCSSEKESFFCLGTGRVGEDYF